MRTAILVLNGPNLNLLGSREPGVYGQVSLAEVEEDLRKLAALLGVEVDFVQSNHEGVLVDAVQAASGRYQGLVVNLGGYTHSSVAIRDAFAAAEIPFVEIHVSNVYDREGFRRRSLVAPLAAGVVIGFGPGGYRLALRGLVARLGLASA
jgi:3-dehydroquinate dehydratase II